MESTLQAFVPIIEDEYKRLGLFYNAHVAGLALHKIQYQRDTKTFSYSCAEADDMFKKLLGITDFQNFRYEQVFPEEEGAPRFDWSVVLGHAGEFYSTSYFYSYSTILNRWIRFLVVGPQRGLALVAAEDITQKIFTFPRTAGIVENG